MNEPDTLASSCFTRICRICLMYGDLFKIDETSWEGLSLRDAILSWSLLKLDAEDSLPKQMCKDCIRMIYQTYYFIYKCRKSETLLKNVLSKELKKIQNENDNRVKVEQELLEVKTESKDVDNIETKLDMTEIKIADPAGQYEDKKFSDESDNNMDCDDPSEVESNTPELEEPSTENAAEKTLVHKINVIKEQISKIRVKNKVKLKKMAKAQLLDYEDLPKSNKRQYVFKKGPPYTCITCNSSYSTHEQLKRHKIDTKHKKSLKYSCKYCERKYDTYCKFEEHVRTHTGEKPNKCPTCGKCFNFKTDLKRHMVMHMEVKPYICRFCEKGFARRQYLVDHERKHTGEQLLCPFCGKGFHSYSTLSYHEKTHKGPVGAVRNPLLKDKLYQCHLCEKALLTEQTLKAHILLHGPKNFSCEICGKTYISKNRLQDHIKLTHQESKFSCHLCSKEYKQKSGLDVHLKSHSGENNYPCDVCGKRFACKGSLYQHKRLHTGDTKYQCKECFHICINRRHLENHLRIHTGEKPFACMYCGKVFAQKANMQAHTKIHSGEKNHICKLCNKAFYDTRGLKKHMNVHEKHQESENGR